MNIRLRWVFPFKQYVLIWLGMQFFSFCVDSSLFPGILRGRKEKKVPFNTCPANSKNWNWSWGLVAFFFFGLASYNLITVLCDGLLARVRILLDAVFFSSASL